MEKREKRAEREEWKLDERNIELKYLVSRGNFGNLYRGIYHNGEESIDVAVEVFDWGEESKETAEITSSRKAFQQEISSWYKLEHPNIAKMIGAVYNKAGQYGEIERLENSGIMVMEYIPRGLTLKSYISKHVKTKLEFDVVMKFALGLARGLSFLHSKKIIHRDVKLENVFLDEELNVKFSNFKVARFEHDYNQDDDLKTEIVFHENGLEAEITDPGIFCTKDASNRHKISDDVRAFGYMAPEVRKKIPYDHKCDVYSFGLCLWEIYCCDEPFPRLNYYQNVAFTYEYPKPRIPKCCPKSLGMIMVKCWDSDPKRRPEMREVVRMLEAIDVSKSNGMTVDDRLNLLSCLWRG